MTDLFSDEQKASIAANIEHLHDTFSRNIIVYKEAKKVVISTDPNFNYLYGNSGATTSIENIPEKKVFKARIRYDTDRSLEYFGEADAQMKVNRTDRSSQVRIKLKKADYDYIKEAKRIELDGRMFHVDSDARAHGVFNVDYYTLFLRSVE